MSDTESSSMSDNESYEPSITDFFYVEPAYDGALELLYRKYPGYLDMSDIESFDQNIPFTISIYNGEVEGGIEFEYEGERLSCDYGRTFCAVFSNDVDKEWDKVYKLQSEDYAVFAYLYDFLSGHRYIVIDKDGNGCGGRGGRDWNYVNWRSKGY